MTPRQLRDYIDTEQRRLWQQSQTLGYPLGSIAADNKVVQSVNVIMAKIQEHVRFVIAEDMDSPPNPTKFLYPVDYQNNLRAEQRKRGGL